MALTRTEISSGSSTDPRPEGGVSPRTHRCSPTSGWNSGSILSLPRPAAHSAFDCRHANAAWQTRGIVSGRLNKDRTRAASSGRRGRRQATVVGQGSLIAAEPVLGTGVSFNQSTVVAHVTFREMCRCILPLSKWWVQRVCEGASSLVRGEK